MRNVDFRVRLIWKHQVTHVLIDLQVKFDSCEGVMILGIIGDTGLKFELHLCPSFTDPTIRANL